jgi:HD-GYP domain-containing protein (c-di-GMP phosphodiesterase class II)
VLSIASPAAPFRITGGRRRLLADLDAEIESRALEVIALRPEQAVSAPWLLEDTPRVPRHLAAAVAAAAGARGARAYRIDPLLYAALGPAEMARDEIAASVRADIERTTPGMSRAVLSGTAWLPEEVPGRAVLGLCLERLEARARRQSGSTERQVRDVLLRLLAERRAGRFDGRTVWMSEFAVTVGRRMGLSLDELDVVLRAAELQDIGKAMLADSILDKREALSDDEWKSIRRHPLVAEHVLGGAPALQPVARLARSCAERFDGSGYPDGLQGAAIPLGARIIAVCAAFDAMTADRPYRPALPVAEAVAELNRFAGAQFDPNVVETFCSVLEDDGAPARSVPRWQ